MSREDKHYENAPIIISILQLRFNPIENFDIDLIIKNAGKIKKEFPIVSKGTTQNINVNKDENDTSFSLGDSSIDVVRIISNNKKQVFVIEKDKFTYQSQEKYSGWEEFFNKSMMYLNIFNADFQIEEFNRVSLRYVNKFELPIDTKDITQYFTTYLKDDVNTHNVSSFQYKFTSFDKENNYTSHIGHSMENPISDFIPYILDIDLILIDKIKNTNKILLEVFNKMRIKKNQIFNSSITDKTKTLIK